LNRYVDWTFDEGTEGWLYSLRKNAFGAAENLYGCTFEKDNHTVPQMEQMRKYAEHWEEMRRQNVGLLLWGPPGSGKSFAAACIANARIECYEKVRMTTLGMVLNRLPALTPQQKEDYLKELRTCDLLVLDDFGMERRTDYAREQVFSIVDGRYQAKKPLIITTNLTLHDLKSAQDIDDRRVFDRVLEMCVPVCFDGESQRKALLQGKMDAYLDMLAL